LFLGKESHGTLSTSENSQILVHSKQAAKVAFNSMGLNPRELRGH